VSVCTTTIRKEEKWRYISLNPSAPGMRGLPKIHKTNWPIRPVINWQNAPAYRLAKLPSKLLQLHIPLPNAFSVKNLVYLMEDLKGITIDQNTKLASFDITNMYSNVPTDELENITKLISLHQNLDDKITEDIISMTRTIVKQNYFQFQDKFHIQNVGLAMGSPTPSVLSEIYLQFMESTKLYNILLQNNVLGYFRYVDNILIVYNDHSTDTDKLLELFNNALPTMTFSTEKEPEDSINVLDIMLKKIAGNFSFIVHRKPTTTDNIIPSDSNHPREKKHAAIHCLLNRMDSYLLSRDAKERERNTIKQILHNNKYDPSIIEGARSKHTEKQRKGNSQIWAKYTYTGK